MTEPEDTWYLRDSTVHSAPTAIPAPESGDGLLEEQAARGPRYALLGALAFCAGGVLAIPVGALVLWWVGAW